MTDEALKTVEHYIEGPRKPVLQEKQLFLVAYKLFKVLLQKYPLEVSFLEGKMTKKNIMMLGEIQKSGLNRTVS